MKKITITLIAMLLITCRPGTGSSKWDNLAMLLRIREKNKATVYAVTVTGTAKLGGTIKGAKVELRTIPTAGVDAGKCNGTAGVPLSDPVTTTTGDASKNDGGSFKIIFPKTNDKIACLVVTPTPTSTMYSPLNNKLIRWKPSIQNGVNDVRVASIISLPEPTLQKHSSKSANVNPLTNLGAGAFAASIRQSSGVSSNLFKRIERVLAGKEPIFAKTLSETELLTMMEKQNNKVGEQFFKNSKVKIDPSDFDFDADPKLNKQLSAILGGMDKAVNDAAKKKGVNAEEGAGDLFDNYLDGITNDFAGDGKLDGKGIVGEDGEVLALDPNDDFYSDFQNPSSSIAADMLDYIQSEIAEGGDDEWDSGDLSDPSLTGGDICTAGYDATGNCIGSFAGANDIPEGFPSPGDFGQITTAANSDGTLTLSWTGATDAETGTSLQYKVYYATDPDLLDVEFVEAFGTPLNDYTAGITNYQVTGLASGFYYFNVLVKDADENISSYTMEQALYVGDGTGGFGGGGQQVAYADLCANVIPIYISGQTGLNNQLFWNAFDCNDIMILDVTGTVVIGTATVDETLANPITITLSASSATLQGTLANNTLTLSDGTNTQSLVFGIIPGASGSTPGGGTFTVSGNVSGLTSGSLVLQNNSGDDETITSDGFFTFGTALNSGDPYSVTILTQPAGLTCSITNDTGTISADVTNVTVNCAASTFTVSGSVTGLSGSLVLQNNGGDDETITADGVFTFSTALSIGSGYNVTVLTQPAGQTCTISNQSGTISANVTTISLVCAASTGGLDLTFGSGSGFTIFTGGSASIGLSLVIDSTGRIWATGGYVDSGDMDTSLWRYDANGVIDTSFETSGLTFYPHVGTSQQAYGIDKDLSDNVYIVTQGNPSNTLEVLKYDGGPGLTSIYTDANRTPAPRSILHDAGTLYISATCFASCSSGGADISLLKIDTTGSPFGGPFDFDGFYDGTTTINETNGSSISMFGGSLFIAAKGDDGSSNLGIGAMKIDPSSGALDTISGFGSFNGKAVYPVTGIRNVASMAIDSTGRIYLISTSSVNPAELIRLDATGALDTTFATSGVFTFGASDFLQDVIVDALDRPVIVGATASTAPSDLKIWRLDTNGTLDPSFNSVGFITHAAGAGTANFGITAKIDPNGKILVIGMSTDAGNIQRMTMWRFNP